MTGARVVFILAALSPFCFAAIVLIGAVRHMRSGKPEERDDEMAVAEAAGVTVPPLDGSHESLPEDKETYEAFWSLAKTIGIEVKQ